MSFRFPLNDVSISITEHTTQVHNPKYFDDWMRLNQTEFALNVEGVADFYACDGKSIFINPVEGYDRNALELYLNGSVYGAILHQRMVLPMHGSCFKFKGIGVMICGESGAGKSSVTVSFSLQGAGFLTDDVTPILFEDGKPYIWAMSDRIKLWADSLDQLRKEKNDLVQIEPETEKYYFPMDSDKGKLFPLNQIFLLEVYDQPEVLFQEINGLDKFTALRNEIYRWEYLEGMKDSEANYFNQLIYLSKNIQLIKVLRPEKFEIEALRIILSNFIMQNNLVTANE